MRLALRATVVFALGLTLSAPLRAEEGILVVHVEDVKGNPVTGVTLAPKGDGAAGSPTDKLGKTRLRLAPATKPGHWVTLQIVPKKKGGPDWVFVSPWNQRTLVPSFANESENFVEVVLGERGNRDLLASDQAIKAIAARTLEQLGPKLDKSEITEEERKKVLAEQAAAFGLKPEEVDKAVRTWGAKAKDPYDAGLAALYERNYPEAEERLEKSLETRKQERNEAQAKVAEAAFFLAKALAYQGKNREAAVAYQESLEAGGESTTKLNNLGLALLKIGDSERAASYLTRALELSEKTLGEEHPDLARTLNNLALLYDDQDRYSEAKPLFQRSLKIMENALGREHPDVATVLNNLAELCRKHGQYNEASPLFQRSLEIWEKVLEAEDPRLALSLNNIALVHYNQEKFETAEGFSTRALAIAEKSLGPCHSNLATMLENRAGILKALGRTEEAHTLLDRVVKIESGECTDSH